MTGSAKQSMAAEAKMDCFVAALLAMTRIRRSQIHHHIIAFHRDLDRLRHIRALHHACARLDVDGIGLGAETLRVAIGLPGADIEFPAMPGTADDLAQSGVFDL